MGIRIVLPEKINTNELLSENVLKQGEWDRMKLVHFYIDSYQCPDKDLRITM